jgi:predicted helicase
MKTFNQILDKFRVVAFSERDKGDRFERLMKTYLKTNSLYENIPLKVYDYVVNGKSAIEWIMERYQVKTDPASQITNDPNDWSKEHDDEKYIFNLLLRIITVSVKTNAIVKRLPKLEF